MGIEISETIAANELRWATNCAKMNLHGPKVGSMVQKGLTMGPNGQQITNIYRTGQKVPQMLRERCQRKGELLDVKSNLCASFFRFLTPGGGAPNVTLY